MEQQTLMNETQLIEQALNALIEKLGAVETNHFLSLKATKRVDSALRHQTWQKTLDKNTFFNEVF